MCMCIYIYKHIDIQVGVYVVSDLGFPNVTGHFVGVRKYQD